MRLVVNRGKAEGKVIKVAGPSFLIGRDDGCQLRPMSDEVSRRHAELKIVASIAVIIDLGSATGTRVNGRLLNGPASLQTGDRIQIGPLSFTALMEDPEPSISIVPPELPRSTTPRKQSTEDLVSSWLIDEEDSVGDVRGGSGGGWGEDEVGMSDDSARGDLDRRSPGIDDSNSLDLLKSMTIHRAETS